MGIGLFPVMEINILNQFRYIREKNLYIILWKKCYKNLVLRWCPLPMKKNFNNPLIMTNADEENFNKADKFYICDKKCVEKDIRARDYCHITDK